VRELETAIEQMPEWSDAERTTPTAGKGNCKMLPAIREPDVCGDDIERGSRRRAWLRWRSAETRMRAAFAALEGAEGADRSTRGELERLAATFERASVACAAAHAVWERLERVGDAEKEGLA
jgi:hypothetical protein